MTLTRIKNEARSNIQLSHAEWSIFVIMASLDTVNSRYKMQQLKMELTPWFSFYLSSTELVWFYICVDPCTVFREDPVLSSNNLIKHPSTSTHIGSYPLAVLCFWFYFRPNIFGKKHKTTNRRYFVPFCFLYITATRVMKLLYLATGGQFSFDKYLQRRSGGWRHSPFLFLNVSIAYSDAQMIHWNRIWVLIKQNVRNAWCETQGW